MTVLNCLFEGNAGPESALQALRESNLTISGSSFKNNSAGAVSATNSVITLEGTPRNVFMGNGGGGMGALKCSRGTLVVRGK